MKRIYYLLLFLYFGVHAQVLESDKMDKKGVTFKYASPFNYIPKNSPLKIYNQNIDKSLIFPKFYNSKIENDIQRNLNELNIKCPVNPYSIPKTIYNPNGATTPKQAIIVGFLNGIAR